MNEKEKYVKLSDVKKKLNYIYRTYGVSPQMKQTISNALTRIPYAIKGELETVLEVVPVRHGEWVKSRSPGGTLLCNCSVCGDSAISQDNDWGDVIYYHETDFCPYCGARMDGGISDGINE